MNEESESIETYRDYTYIMYIMCDKTASYYSKIKNTINIPIVCCSAGLSMMNTYSGNEQASTSIRNIGVVLNLLIAVSIGILNMYKITEKEFFFSSQAVKFLKTYNKVNIEIAKSKTKFEKIDLISIITEYNILCEHIQFHIPSHIRKRILNTYKKYKMPFLLTNTKKEKKKFWNYFTNSPKKDEDNKSTQSDSNGSYSLYISDSNVSTPPARKMRENTMKCSDMSPIQSSRGQSPTNSLKPFRSYSSPINSLKPLRPHETTLILNQSDTDDSHSLSIDYCDENDSIKNMKIKRILEQKHFPHRSPLSLPSKKRKQLRNKTYNNQQLIYPKKSYPRNHMFLNNNLNIMSN